MTKLVLPSTGSLEKRDLLGMAFDGLGEKTMGLYRGDWERFLDWAKIDAAEFFALAKVEAAALVNRYLKSMARRGYAPATRARARQAICVIVDRLYAADALPWTLAKLIKTPKVRAFKETEGISPEDWRALLRAARSDGSRRGARDVAIMLLLYDSALRRREVASLRLEDWDARWSRVHVWAKGDEEGERTPVPVTARTKEALIAWLKYRGRAPGGLFTGLRDASPINGDGVAYAVRDWCRRAEIPEIGPHQLRHAAITALARKGAPPPLLQRFARHASFDMTMHYIHTDATEIRELAEQLSEDEGDEEVED